MRFGLFLVGCVVCVASCESGEFSSKEESESAGGAGAEAGGGSLNGGSGGGSGSGTGGTSGQSGQAGDPGDPGDAGSTGEAGAAGLGGSGGTGGSAGGGGDAGDGASGAGGGDERPIFTELRVDGFVAVDARAVSGDGTYVAGEATLVTGYMEAVRWKDADGASLGTKASWVAGHGVGISDDGAVVVGYIDTRAGQLAFRWEDGVIDELPPLVRDSGYAEARGVSGDGNVVIGTSPDPDVGQNMPVTWVGGGVQQLPMLMGHITETPTGVDYDGNVIVGTGTTAGDFAYEAVRWPANGVFSLEIPRSEVYSVSSDGRYAVGAYVETPMLGQPQRTAFRWSASGVEYLPPAMSGDVSCAAYFTSGDGSIVVGSCYELSTTSSRTVIYLWSEATGIVPVDQVLRELGVDTSLYDSLGVADISTDGTAIIGSATDVDGVRIGWRAYIDSVFP